MKVLAAIFSSEEARVQSQLQAPSVSALPMELPLQGLDLSESRLAMRPPVLLAICLYKLARVLPVDLFLSPLVLAARVDLFPWLLASARLREGPQPSSVHQK
jgi:hypothetical protein